MLIRAYLVNYKLIEALKLTWDDYTCTGLEIVTDTVANATNIFSLVTKNSSLFAKVATRFLYDLDLN